MFETPIEHPWNPAKSPPKRAMSPFVPRWENPTFFSLDTTSFNVPSIGTPLERHMFTLCLCSRCNITQHRRNEKHEIFHG